MAEEVQTPVEIEATAEAAAADEPATTTSDKAEITSEAPKPAKRKKSKRSVASGQLHILATFNNTIVTFTDSKGAVLTTASAGGCGFRGSKKGTAYAAQVAGDKAAQAAKQAYGLSKVDVYISGIGQGRDAPIRVLSGLNIGVESITDVTGVPHGGVRPKKARRV